MPQTHDRAVMNWLFSFAIIVAFLIVFGGFVRLTRSGLSITEWNPIRGAVPPIGEHDWQAEFVKYQETPEFQQVNFNMDLQEYKYIFWIEWIHRFIARFAGLFYAIPVFFFLFTKKIPLKEFGIYFLMGMLFISQAFAGWIMVASGLVDRPSVSHFNLTIHLLLALTLLGISLWTALGHSYKFDASARSAGWSLPSKLALISLIILLIQITYGGFTAGLKAGHVSDTWPLMFGELVPPNLFNSLENIFESPQTIVFIHRWFAWLGLIMVPYVFWVVKKQNYPADIQNGLKGLVAVVALQIALGIWTVLSFVNLWVALIHQANAIVLFALAVYLIHRFRALDAARQMYGKTVKEAYSRTETA
jgi:cytochrome c oxidase assembly protein subunit 15